MSVQVILFRFETSAKENKHIEEACGFLIQKILEKDNSIPDDVRPVAPRVRDPLVLDGGGGGRYLVSIIYILV